MTSRCLHAFNSSSPSSKLRLPSVVQRSFEAFSAQS